MAAPQNDDERAFDFERERLRTLDTRKLLETIADQVLALGREQSKLIGIVIGHGAQIKGVRLDVRRITRKLHMTTAELRASVEELEEEVENTGKHRLEEAEAKAKELETEKKERERHWFRYAVSTAVALIIAIVLALVGYALGKRAANDTKPTPAHAQIANR